MKNIIEYLKDKYGPWGWLGQRAHDAEGINRILPLDFIISCDYGTEVPHYFREEDVFSIEKQNGIRKDWSNEDLNDNLRGALGRNIFERWKRYPSRVNLLCYRSVSRLENKRFLPSRKPVIHAASTKLKKYFDNKLLLYRNLPKLSLPRIKGKVEAPGKATFEDLRKELSLPFVVQFPYGSGGNFTFIIREKKEYDRLRENYPDIKVIMRRYVDGFSLNVNAVVLSDGNGCKTVCTSPSVQITGLPECSNFLSSFCGNDFAAARDLDRRVIADVESHIGTIGAWMGKKGFRGVFGMDFVVERDTVYPVEINPRFQNSTALYTSLSAESVPSERSFFLLHAAEFLRHADPLMKKYMRDFPCRELMAPLDGSQVILRNRTRRSVVKGKLVPGVYRMNDGALEFTSGSASLDACRRKGDVLVTCGVPSPSTVVEENAPVCKIQMKTSALEASGKRSLSPETAGVIAALYDKIALEDASDDRT